MSGRFQTAVAFSGTLWTCRSGRSRQAFETWQKRRLDTWLRQSLPKVDFYRDAPPRLDQLPVIDKAIVMSRFETFNRERITTEDGWRALETGGEINGINIGASTGTSGNRGLYAITAAERFRWLGTILAKTLPGFLWHRERVAIILPQSSSLYESPASLRQLQLRFFDLRHGIAAWLDDLETFDPTTIVAPPRVLRHLAETSNRLAPRKLYAGAETLDPVDRVVIEQRFGLTLGQIYMATEGLFAVTCAQGRLHLAEDANYFELEPVANGLVTPLVTGFRRDFQIMARYRMNDLLRLSSDPCTCGSPLQAVDEVVGRMDDIFVFANAAGVEVPVTPDILRNAVLDASREISDFRLVQEDDGSVTLLLPPDLPDTSAEAARMALGKTLSTQGLTPAISLHRERLPLERPRKLRRVECRLKRQGRP
ncbi:F390 synthetase-related protein [Roseibium sp. FZY0029]|uniref:F390 synthetase-related protein n=1 Tax=Roseibium sp. FZY0029 TaxID=3116647 RepID=UPI002EBC7B4F|nr:F390 synthetase-related protein [Roseibium sp. FZY0029]